MKINIVTMNSSYNYGAMLQAYALQQTLKSLGHSCKFIDQRTACTRHVNFNFNPKKLYQLPLQLIFKNSIEKGYRRFEKFITDHQNLTLENFGNYEKLKSSPPAADAFITGSDQVFNPISFRPINFLDFVPDGKKRISYAASIGVSSIPDEKRGKFKQYIDKMDFISVREQSAKNILSDLTDKQIEVNIDPVFLLDKTHWEGLAQPVNSIKKPFILCYILYRPKWLNGWLKKLSQKHGLEIILVDNTSFRNIYHNKMIRDAGPKEFLWLFSNAEMIITSSFHGTAFSTIFNKPFYALPNPSAPARITDLLSILNLSEAVLHNDLNLDIPRFNYTITNDIVNFEKKKSIDYLTKALEN